MKLPLSWLHEWIEFDAPEKTEVDLVSHLDELHVRERLRLAAKWARLYGGAGIYVALEDGRKPDQPIDFTAIRRVKALVVLNRFELTIQAGTVPQRPAIQP